MAEGSVSKIGELLRLEEYGVVTFVSTTAALKGEKVMKDSEYAFVVMPTPREITTSCGLSLKIKSEDIRPVAGYLANNAIGVEGLFRLKKKDGRREVTVLEK
ncbi:MAG: DUF3343 domain-containing protein [Acidobacteriota bacterium]